MVFNRKIDAFTLLLLFSVMFSFGQGNFELPGKQQDKIRFELINNLIVIPVEINGVKLSFLLDTGVSKPILFNITNTDSLQMNNVETIFLRGLGAGETVKALKSKNNFLKIGNAININQEIYVVFDQEINFTPKLGIPVHGIIGYNLFKDFIVEINYRSKVIKLNRREGYTYKTCKQCETFTLSFHNDKPYIDGEVILGEDTLPVKLLIDTGSSDALWLFEDDSHGITAINNNYFHDFLGRGLSGNVHGKRSKISAFKLKNFTLNNVNAAFPDSSAIKHAKRIENRNGSLSGEILRRFNVIFDYENAKMTLKKNANFKDKFRYNRSGIVLEQHGFRMVKESVNKKSVDNYGRSNDDNITISNVETYRMGLKPAYTIIEVRENSPAEKAGLLKEDIVVSINGKKAHELKLQEVIHYFRGKVGKMVRLKIERGGQIINVEFRLEDVFKKKELPN
nr:aspartyl protease family protein [uncultured Psychroserpens sp.]